MTTAADRRWFAAVASIPACVLCGQHGVQVAHRDYGKGMGLKTKPYETAAICAGCHQELTDGTTFDRETKRALMDRAIVSTHTKLIDSGLVGLK